MKPDSNPSQKDHTNDEIVNEVKPWARFFARKIDEGIYIFPSFLAAIIVGIAMGLRDLDPETENMIFLIIMLVALFVAFCLWFISETLFISFFGTTPGKWIFRIQVRYKDGGLLSFWDAVKRAYSVLCFGFGFCIPLFWLISHGMAYARLTKSQDTRWDTDLNTQVIHRKSDMSWKILQFITAGIAVVFVLTIRLLDAVAQFL